MPYCTITVYTKYVERHIYPIELGEGHGLPCSVLARAEVAAEVDLIRSIDRGRVGRAVIDRQSRRY